MKTIEIARKNKKLTQEELAKKIGVNRATISKYENGSISPTLGQLKRIAKELDVSVGDLSDSEGVAQQLLDTSKFLSAEFDSCRDQKLKESAIQIVQSVNRIFSEYREICGQLDIRASDNHRREYENIELMNYCRVISHLSGRIGNLANEMAVRIQQDTVDRALQEWKSKDAALEKGKEPPEPTE